MLFCRRESQLRALGSAPETILSSSKGLVTDAVANSLYRLAERLCQCVIGLIFVTLCSGQSCVPSQLDTANNSSEEQVLGFETETPPWLTASDDTLLQTSTDEGADPSVAETNPLTVQAGEDFTVFQGGEVALEGRIYSESQVGNLTFEWRQLGGATVTLRLADTPRAYFQTPIADADIPLTFEFTATDGVWTASDEVMVTALSLTSQLTDEPSINLSVAVSEGPAPFEITCSAVSAQGVPLPEGNYMWSFGDNATKTTTIAEATHTYDAAGEYDVTLCIYRETASTTPILCLSETVTLGDTEISDTFTISGHVFDEDGKGIPAVIVGDGSELICTTDSTGRYSLQVPGNSSGTISPRFESRTYSPGSFAFSQIVADVENRDFQQNGFRLTACPPGMVLHKLDFEYPGLASVKASIEAGEYTQALTDLRTYYRNTYPIPSVGTSSVAPADQIVNHVFQWQSYPPVSYGTDVDWSWDPYDDNEWVCAMQRFFWAIDLADAYAATRNDQYARTFVELVRDWIDDHPLEYADPSHPSATSEITLAWKDLQTARRAQWLCYAFKKLVHSSAFTPEFLGVFLASLIDHQAKTECLPRVAIDNMVITESRGLSAVATTFPEFAESLRWVSLAVERTEQNLSYQLTSDGVQREFAPSYHWNVAEDASGLLQDALASPLAVPTNLRNMVRQMHDHLLGIATPDLCLPMFGDSHRDVPTTADRRYWPLYSTLTRASEFLGDSKYEGVASLDAQALPSQHSYAFSESGIYAMRSGWDRDDIYLALHCSPPSIEGHDQPDNGTFELSAFGRWLMTDSGFYTYSGDTDARAWHRQTAVHQTLTLDHQNAVVDGRHLLWQSTSDLDALVVENPSYPDLTHRRTVWFVNRQFFVLLDEAIGNAAGTLRLHFQLAVGDSVTDAGNKLARTRFTDANVLVSAGPAAPLSLEVEEGWYSSGYGLREQRTAFCFRHQQQAPVAYLTTIIPYAGTLVPVVSPALPADFVVGSDEVSLEVTVAGETWFIGRSISGQQAWAYR